MKSAVVLVAMCLVSFKLHAYEYKCRPNPTNEIIIQMANEEIFQLDILSSIDALTMKDRYDNLLWLEEQIKNPATDEDSKSSYIDLAQDLLKDMKKTKKRIEKRDKIMEKYIGIKDSVESSYLPAKLCPEVKGIKEIKEPARLKSATEPL